MNIKISALKMFVAVVEAGNIHDAANRVNRSASAVSTALKLMEADVGGALFETDRKNQLTALGGYLYKTALAQVSGYEKALADVQAFAKGHLGKLQIASIPSIATSIISETLVRFRESYPEVDVELWDMDTATISRWVEQGRVDFGIGGIPDNPRVSFETILKDELVLVYPENFDFGMPKQAQKIDDLLSYPCITNGVIANSRDKELQAFHQASRLFVHNTSSLLALVASGAGITILPRLSASMGFSGVKHCEVDLTTSYREVGLITNPSQPVTPVSDLFLSYLRTAA
ncbi:MAG: LysR family transcriptional regulator [Alphaproteobacteria bacterium]|nr:LysR family transcriptional regulator [Alphaproteobacteria bacterium]